MTGLLPTAFTAGAVILGLAAVGYAVLRAALGARRRLRQ
jgi:hypothetical protein